jgi:hypothetical protein
VATLQQASGQVAELLSSRGALFQKTSPAELLGEMVSKYVLVSFVSCFGLVLGGDGRFNKAYCLTTGGLWGNSSFWQMLINNNTTRIAQFSTVNVTGGVHYLTVAPVSGSSLGAFSLSSTPSNLTIDYGCDPRAMPSYSAIGIGNFGASVVTYAAGPVGDLHKRGRCYFARCNRDENEADFCGSEGEAPCAKTNATFIRYVSPSGAPNVDTACYSILTDSQVDPLHRVDWKIEFVDAL